MNVYVPFTMFYSVKLFIGWGMSLPSEHPSHHESGSSGIILNFMVKWNSFQNIGSLNKKKKKKKKEKHDSFVNTKIIQNEKLNQIYWYGPVGILRKGYERVKNSKIRQLWFHFKISWFLRNTGPNNLKSYINISFKS